jgi:hypothetical protein
MIAIARNTGIDAGGIAEPRPIISAIAWFAGRIST